MKNQVIKALNNSHGREIIEYWKKRGYDTRDSKGVVNESSGYKSIYYGVINNHFANYSLQEVTVHNVEIIELPKGNIIPMRELKPGEYGKIIYGGLVEYQGLIVKMLANKIIVAIGGNFSRLIHWENYTGLTIKVEKLENFKIVYDGHPEQIQSEYPKVMWVSLHSDFKTKFKRVVFKKVDNKYVAWDVVETIKGSENATSTNVWTYAKDIEEKVIVELTLQDISEGKGVGVPSHLIRIKE